MTTVMHYDSVEQLYRATATPRLVRVPPLMFLCIDGHGDPNTSPTYADAVRALFSMCYAAKFAIKRASGQNVKVSPLEGLWWAHDMDTFLTGRKSDWDWTMMIRQPDLVTGDLVERLAAELTPRSPCRRCRTFGWSPLRKVLPPRCCTWARTPTRDPPSNGCTTSSATRVSSSTDTTRTPRDLSRRSAPGGAGEATNDHQTTLFTGSVGLADWDGIWPSSMPERC